MTPTQTLHLQQLQAQAAEMQFNLFSAYIARAALGVVKGIVQGIKPGTLQRAILLDSPLAKSLLPYFPTTTRRTRHKRG